VNDDLLLKYSHNVVEHLGLKLYQNRPTRVIAEIVSNAWDADAKHVQVNMSMGGVDRWIAVLDDGHGMTRKDLASSYLIIGLGRRVKADDRSRSGRRLMGRKGIGKLAPFGIARFVDVVTAAKTDGISTVYWLRFDLVALLTQGSGEVSYRPDLIVSGGYPETLPLEKDRTGQIKTWLGHIQQTGTGTLILMTGLSLGRAISDSQLMDSLGHRFTITLGHDFEVTVNGQLATAENTLPEFEFRIPPTGQGLENVGDREVKFWVGFVRNASWPADQAGVGVYSHGKIAQDRPFTFGVKGKEIFTRYMFGVVEAEWLDELESDVISTDRTSVNWEASETEPLHEWGKGKVRDWVTQFEKWRQGQEEDDNRKIVQTAVRSGGAPKVTEPEEEEIVRLVSSITPAFGKDEESKERLVRAVSDAWVQKPMRKLVRDLWESLGAGGDMPPAAFTQMVERLSSHSVPESLNLAVVFAQRAFALTRLHDYVHHGSEVDLQKLLEKFPWIVEPDLSVLTANQQLKTAVKKAEELGQIPTGRRVNVGGVPDVNKPDFVFLSSPSEHQIVIVELKNPQEDLTLENRVQLQDYLAWFEAHYPDADRRGYLIGRKPNNMVSPYQGLTILPWTDVLNRSRARNLELLAAMLLKTGSSGAADARAADAIQLGGPEAKELLERLAVEHDEIRNLMKSFEIIEKKSG
jgi:hypothetical protein